MANIRNQQRAFMVHHLHVTPEGAKTDFKGFHGSFKDKRKTSNRQNPRRTSMGLVPLATTLAIPQLDAIQRSQKLLDVRLQHLQANSKENNRMMDDVEFIRRLMTKKQKALCNVVQVLANMQGEIVNLAQCLKPSPPRPSQPPQLTQTARSITNTPATSPIFLPNDNTHYYHHHPQQNPPPMANAVSSGGRNNVYSAPGNKGKRGSRPDEDESKV